MQTLIKIVILSIVFTACRSAQEPTTDAIKSAIQQELDKCVLAVNTENIALYMELIPEDFELTDQNGQIISRQQQEEFILRDWSIIDTTLYNRYIIDSITVYKDSVIVFTSQKWERLMFQRDGITKDTVITTQLHREKWLKKSGQWKNYGIMELGGDIYINGALYIE